MEESNADTEEIIGPGGGGPQVEGAYLPCTPADQLLAEGGANETQPAGHHEGAALYPLVLAQMHLSFRYSSEAEQNRRQKR